MHEYGATWIWIAIGLLFLILMSGCTTQSRNMSDMSAQQLCSELNQSGVPCVVQ